MDIVHARDGETLDSLIWRARGLGPGDLPAILAANPGLAAIGAVLPKNTAVAIPAIAQPVSPLRDTIQLWD